MEHFGIMNIVAITLVCVCITLNVILKKYQTSFAWVVALLWMLLYYNCKF